MSRKYDLENVRVTARGHWGYIVDSICGVSSSAWPTTETECPKCGGNTRFRKFADFDETGGVFCNHCPESKADGFGTIAWLTGCTFPEALRKVAEFLGMDKKPEKPAKEKKKKQEKPKKPQTNLITPLKELREEFARKFAAAKPGVDLATLLAAPWQSGRYGGRDVIAIPGYIPNDPKIESCTLYHADGSPFIREGRGSKNKNIVGSHDAMIFVNGRERFEASHFVVKCEGWTDAVSVAAIVPDGWAVVTNACGCGSWRAEFLDFFHGKTVIVLHDCDEPGQEGAAKWVSCLQPVAETFNVVLPYPITGKSGKDARDFIADGKTWADFENLFPPALLNVLHPAADAAADSATEGDTNETNGTSAPLPLKPRDDFAADRSMLADLGIDVLGQVDRPGKVLVYSSAINRLEVIDDVGRLRRPTLKGLCGKQAGKINASVLGEDIPGTYKFDRVLDAIGILGSQRVVTMDNVRGAGCWASNGSGVVLVGHHEAMLYRGGELTKIAGARDGNELLGIGKFDPWYVVDEVADNLKRCSLDWNNEVIDEAIQYFSQWCWTNETDPMLLVGCILSSWVQTLWRFRPHIAVSGKTNSGKSSLFMALECLYGKLANNSSKSSAAGIRQTVQQSARITMLDEFEKSKHRPEILEMIRAASRGAKIQMGSSVHKAVHYTAQHIFWIGSTETGLQKAPDRNRFICFDLKMPDRSNHGKLPPPDPYYLGPLGQKLLAIAIHSVIASREVADRLRAIKCKADARIVEAHAVPSAMLSVACGANGDELMSMFLGSLQDEATEQISDEQELIQALMRSTVRIRSEEYSVARLLSESIHGNEEGLISIEHNEALERAGVRYLKPEESGKDYGAVFIDHKRIKNTIAKIERDWEGQDLKQHLMRLDGAETNRRRIDSSNVRGVLVPITSIELQTPLL